MILLSKIIVNNMVAEERISDEDRELYEYGILVILRRILFGIVIITFMLLIDRVVEGLCFLAAFSLVRRSAGGLHCKTFAGCFMLSVLSILLSVVLIKIKMFDIMYYRIAVIAAEAILLIMRPVDCNNKRISREEKQFFYRKLIKVIILIDAVLFILALLNFTDMEKAIESALIVSAVTGGIAFINDKHYTKEE